MALRTFRIFFLSLTWFFSIALLMVIILATLSYYDLMPSRSILHLVGFAPTPFVGIAILFPILAFLSLRRWKCAIGMLISYLIYVVLCGDYSFHALLSKPEQKSQTAQYLKVVTLNVRYYSYGTEEIIDFIRRTDADVYLLSENTINRPIYRELIRGLGDRFTYHSGKQYETAIVSKLPVESFEEVLLPSHQASLTEGNVVETQAFNSPRAFTHAVISFNHTRVNLISIRFIAGRTSNRSIHDKIAWGQHILATQLDEVAFFQKYVTQLQGPVIFGGDLNATPGSRIIRDIAKFAQDSFLDVHAWAKPTFSTERSLRFRLDYLFSRGAALPVEANVLPDTVSDHFPVFAAYKVGGL